MRKTHKGVCTQPLPIQSPDGPADAPHRPSRQPHEEGIIMNVIADLCIVPLGVGVSVSAYIAECERILMDAGLKTQLHAYGTNIEGEWEAVFAAIRRCHEKIHAMGAPRITTTLKFGTRTDREQHMADKVESVLAKLSRP